MRRKEREITEQAKINEIIQNCDCLRLALADEGAPYIVPVSFGYVEEEKAFYFHGAKEGRKIDLIRKNGAAGFECDCNFHLKEQPVDIPICIKASSGLEKSMFWRTPRKSGKGCLR